jgi:predicted nucleic acid-binding protein
MVLDTSIWIEILVGSELGGQARTRLPDLTDIVVPTIVQLELAKWLIREVGPDQVELMTALTGELKVIRLSSELAVLAARLHKAHRLATADAVIYATAQSLGVPLLTCDAHFRDLAGVHYLPKTAG